jgi:methionyl aminopeptidase
MMRRAGLLVWEALFRLAQPLMRPGVTTREVDVAIERFFREHRATSLFKNYIPEGANVPPFPAVTCISINEEVVHGIPGPRQLKEGDIVSLDTGCKLDGWCGDAAVTFAVGKVHPEVQRLLDVTQGVLTLAIDLMGKCSRWSQVAGEMERYVKDHGFFVVETFVGHGIGREMHEEPQVPNFISDLIKKNGDFLLEPGLVIAVEPMVNMGTKRVRTRPDRWTQVTADRRPSAHFEHTVAVTQSGPYVLTAPPGEEHPFPKGGLVSCAGSSSPSSGGQGRTATG